MRFQENVSLAQFSSYKIGGPARYFFEAKTVEDLKSALSEWSGRYFILGGGTNLLIRDEGFDGLVIKPNFTFLNVRGEEIEAGAGILMADLLRAATEHSLSGFEWAGGLPGTVGGAIRGNAGAFGGETKDSVTSVQSFDISGMKELRRSTEECRFDYRSSIFKEKKGKEIIIRTLFRLKEGDPQAIQKTIEEKIRYRNERHPMEYPNIGSIFKNVPVRSFDPSFLPRVENVIKSDPFPVVPAAFLISETGVKGIKQGGAMISPKHPNFIVNTGGAKASDVEFLISLVKSAVKKEFHVDLEPEVERV